MLSELLPIFAVHFVLTAAPAIAATLYATHRGVRSIPVLLSIGLAATGLVAMVSFWLYFAEPSIGKGFSVLVLVGSLAAGLWILRVEEFEPELLRRLAVPLLLWGLGSAFVLFLGFSHEGISTPIATSTIRFSHPLPSDSSIPSFFSNWFYAHGHDGSPPVFPGGWLVSDRPPLQIGYVLTQRPGSWGNPELHYQVLGVLLQQLWIVGAWALLVAARVSRVTRAMTISTLLVSGLILVNGFFVWPKLLPAAMLLAASALLLTPEWKQVRQSSWGAALIAALFALALLGHGSSAFMVAPLVGVLLFRRGFNWRWLGVAALVGVLFLAPWSAYQKYGAPPGNRLTNWMLGGDTRIQTRDTLDVILDGYRDAGLAGVVANKRANFDAMTGNLFSNQQAILEIESGMDGGPKELVGSIRTVSFLFLLPSLGFLLLAPFGMIVAGARRRYQKDEMKFALYCLGLAALGCVVWGLLLFGNEPARATIHVGSYVVPILAICGLAIGLRASFPRLAVWFLGLNGLFSLAVYAPAIGPPPGSSYSPVAGVISALSLLGFLAVAWRAGRRSGGAAAGGAPALPNAVPTQGGPSRLVPKQSSTVS